MRRGWIVFLLAASARAQEFSEAELDSAITGIEPGDGTDWPSPDAMSRSLAGLERIAAWGPRARRAVPALVLAWGSAAPELREAASRALLAIGPDAIPDVVKVLRGKDACARGEAGPWLEEYARVGSAAPLAADGEAQLLALLNDTDAAVRLAAARGLATRGAAIVPGMIKLLADKVPRRRQAAAFALGRVEPPPEEAASALLAAASDADASVREHAVTAIGRLKSSPRETVAALLHALADTNEAVASSAQSAMAARGKEIVPHLVGAFDGNDALARGATEALLRFGDAILEQVIGELKSGGPRQRQFGAAYLGALGATCDLPTIERALIPLLSDPSPDVRAAAAEAFGVALPGIAGRAIDALLPAAADPDARVRANALAAAARGAPGDARVRAAADHAMADGAPAVKLAAALVKGDAAAPATWGQAVESAAFPLAARVLAAERLRSVSAGLGQVLSSLAKVVQDPAQPMDLRVSAASTLRILMARRIFEDRFAGVAEPPTRTAVDNALRWLAGAQGKDGRWAAEGWGDPDLGVTGLAILAFLAAGHTQGDSGGAGPYANCIRKGLDFIVSTQRKDGLFIFGSKRDHTPVEHAIATQALCEAVAMTDDRSRRPAAEAALAYCAYARNPYLVWRYEPRGGENDTHVTAWMATTMRIAGASGFTVDPGALEGARRWIDKMTDPELGRVGYNYPGGPSSRAKGKNDDFPAKAGHAMTAAGIWLRMILGEDPRTSEMVKKGADLCLEIRPTFDKPHCADFCYWYFGTLACFEVGQRGAKWEVDLRRALLARQKPDGSWDPEDAWGYAGGRVYSTAILTLALLTPGRYARGSWRASAMPPSCAQAATALKAAASSRSARLRAAALGEQAK